MADLQPLRTLRYEPSVVGSLEDVIAPYDVIDAELRAQLAARSPYNVVEIDLPPSYAQAPRRWPTGSGAACSWRGRARGLGAAPGLRGARRSAPHPRRRARARAWTSTARAGSAARAHAPRAQGGPPQPHPRHAHQPLPHLQPLPRPRRRRRRAMEQVAATEPFASAADLDGTSNTLWRSPDEDLVAELQMALADAELLIADGHHRYETARCTRTRWRGRAPLRPDAALLAVRPGLLVLDPPAAHRPQGRHRQGRDRDAKRDFEIEELSDVRELELPAGRWRSATWTRFTSSPTASPQGPGDRRQGARGHAGPYRRLDTAVLEALVPRRARHVRGRHLAPERARLLQGPRRRDRRRATGRADAGFFMRATPVEAVREVAETGESMPPKSTLLSQGPDRPGVQSPDVKIYMRGGDDGTTGLWYGGRVAKYARPEAYGSVDEAACARAGARRSRARRRAAHRHPARAERAVRGRGELATAPEAADRLEPGVSKVTPEMVDRLEGDIDRYMDRVDLPPKFVIPEAPSCRRAWTARAACGRAERSGRAQGRRRVADEIGSPIRTGSTALFAMARFADEPEPEMFEGDDESDFRAASQGS